MILTTIFLLLCATSAQILPRFEISDQELVSIVNKMREVDQNKARSNQIQLNFQGHTGSADVTDRADKKLFTGIDSSLLRKPTYEALIDLLDNYNIETGVAEKQSTQSNAEIDRFLDLILETPVWSALGPFLKNKGHPFAKDKKTMRKYLKQLWFDNYSRARGQPDTSGFEHVFVGEAKNGEISGMHNWIRFYTLERNASENFDYRGFLVKRGNIMAAVKFYWNKLAKRAGSLLIGTSPEFDFGLYTLCFLSRRSSRTCDVELDGCPMSVTSYDIVQNRKVFIGSIFPSAGRMTDKCRQRNRA
ncbi:unnamed protein product [Bursaphelenchus xylophilus]|uniref:(pine wood nematode) hypothetical protein n=1 Tax=Bursaphelenchus xylophilus TaxID=6326 RepID=A0A1I7SDB1_BURXY|nr:extracellular nuclease 5 [Bursaphelenchus xylophilus]CAD5234673.1 unnamed protein product [Bursaphelenchus xylophilus]CAG9130573.1 unnamed protein product [Bursaphelenchus xylophilus]